MSATTPEKPRSRRRFAKILIWVVASLVLVVTATATLLFLVLPRYLAADSGRYGPTESTELRRFTFLDRMFAIPDNYQPCCRLQDHPDNIWIEALLPDFAPYSKARRDEWFALGTGMPRHPHEIFPPIWMEHAPRRSAPPKLEDAIDQNGQPGPAGLRRYDLRNDSIAVFDIVYVPEQPGDVVYDRLPYSRRQDDGMFDVRDL